MNFSETSEGSSLLLDFLLLLDFSKSRILLLLFSYTPFDPIGIGDRSLILYKRKPYAKGLGSRTPLGQKPLIVYTYFDAFF